MSWLLGLGVRLLASLPRMLVRGAFISGWICPKRGVQMLGDHNDAHILCDDYLNTPPPLEHRARGVFV
jgi:hypothetical protein